MNKKLIIGLTGPFESGCTTIAEILKADGWEMFSLSSILKETHDEDRGSLQDHGNALRKKDIEEGNNGGVLMRKAFERLKNKIGKKDIVIECTKNPGEIEELRTKLNTYIIAINSSFNKRWERLRKKGKYDYNKFEAEAERDKHENLFIPDINKYYGQEVQKCVDYADIVINNEKNYDDEERTKIELYKKISSYLGILRRPRTRFPTNQELLMNNAYCTSLLSRCLKRQVGAIIAIQERYVISSGYNTVPFGQADCMVEYANKCYRDKKVAEIYKGIKYCHGCGKKMNNKICTNPECKYNNNSKLFTKSITLGKGLDICRALHAEENAILQISYLGSGISLDGSTLYTTTFPCMLCAKKIIDVGIKKVVYIEPYPMREAYDMLNKARVILEQFEGVKAQSFFKLFKKYDI